MNGYGTIKSNLEIDEESSITKAERLRKISLAKNGLTVVGTFIFIVGEMAGCGVLALPKALVNTGWIGLVLLPILCFNAGYSGVKLGKCWEIIEERYPEYRAHVRNPYPAIANVAMGPLASTVVTVSIRITLFGAGTVNLLLAAQIFQEIFGDFLPTITSCTYFLFMAIFVTPLMWFGSPKHFSFVGLGAVVTTAAACILFFSQMISDAKDLEKVHHTQFGFEEFFLGFGAILFAFGGASTFPTIQNDMKEKNKFGTSVIMAFILIIMLYFPIAIGGYLIFGDQVADNIAVSLGKSLYVEIGNILMGIHLIFAFLILINPVCQDLEHAFNIPKKFNWKRCVTRTMIILVLIFVGETIPKFSKILSLVGGSTVAMLTFIFPPYLYMKLCDQVSDEWENRYISSHERIYLWELMIVGTLGGLACTYSALISIFGGSSLVKPCYSI
ncbi:amino acid transporter AVT1J-like [Harmonia axyridis]|uniref:amino acid transporter AVT1J-like n=1 Tax=Harmonia axyridis TaxID=115357 RepID=UPI001E275958|nr:amino acid transporter AVT1J-like [Harmonia axyridis]